MNQARIDFCMDVIFGMDGVPKEHGCCVVLDEDTPQERFRHIDTERTFQLWKRGYDSKALAVRDAMKASEHFTAWSDVGSDSIQPIRSLYDEWQDTGFIPRRPGD